MASVSLLFLMLYLDIVDNFNDFIDQLDLENSKTDIFLTKAGQLANIKNNYIKQQLTHQQPQPEHLVHEKSIKYNPDPLTLIPNSLRKIRKYTPPKTAGNRIRYYPPEENIHEQNLKKKNINFKKLNNAYGTNSSSTGHMDNFDLHLNKELGKISHSYGKLDTLKKFTNRPRTNLTAFNRIDSYEKYRALKYVDNIDVKPKLRPLTNNKNQSLEKLSKSIFEMQRAKSSRIAIKKRVKW